MTQESFNSIVERLASPPYFLLPPHLLPHSQQQQQQQQQQLVFDLVAVSLMVNARAT